LNTYAQTARNLHAIEYHKAMRQIISGYKK